MPASDPVPDLRDPISAAHAEWVRHGWAEAADGMAAVTSLVRVHQLVTERIDAALRPFDLTLARFEALRLLAFTASGSMPMSRMGSYLQVHPTSVSSAVARLEDQGYVERRKGATDRRMVLASITESGRSVVEEATRVLNASVFRDLGLPRDSAAQIVAILRDWRGGLGDLHPG